MSNAEYLRSRTKTYDQKKYHFKIDDASTAEHKYQCMDSHDKPCCTTWKPTNKHFVQDGGVSSSTYLNRAKYNTIQNAAASLSNFDHGTIVAHAYSGRAAAPFTLKTKHYPTYCNMYKRDGVKNSCK